MAAEVPKEKKSVSSHVGFKEDVDVRVITTDRREREVVKDKVAKLRKPDTSTPVVIPIELDEKEKKVREKLTGCIRAEKRIYPDYARMYGCGKSVIPLSEYHLDEDDDEKFFDKPPVRVIRAHAPDPSWFTISLKP